MRLSKYQDKLVEYYEQNPDFIKPESRKNEMLNNFIKPGLQDLCVSRSSFKWGVPVSFDDKHVIYVWIDALSNYITGVGYNPDGSSEQYKKLWPADLHVIGKDIVRFHTIYWPIILMALGEPLPKQVLGHPWVLVGEDKMSKSKGNVIYADELAARFGIDAVRYYLLSEIPFTQDGTITYESFITKFNADLANTLGNLVNRTVAMTNKYFGGKVTAPASREELDNELIAVANDTIQKYYSLMDAYRNADACECVMNFAKRLNKYIDETTPWVLAKDEATLPRLNDVLYNLLEGIRMLGIMLTPVIPSSCKSIAAQINSDCKELDFGKVNEFTVGEATPLFARIDMPKVLEEIAAEQAKKAAEAEKAANIVKLPEISIDDFAKVELTTAKIVACEPIPKAKKLLKLTLNDGSGKPRTVASGIAKWYKPEDLIGKSVIVVANLAPRTLCGVESHGMILAGEISEEDVKVVFVDGLPAGTMLG